MKKPSENGKKITAAKVIAGVVTTAAICLNVNGCVYGPAVPPSDNQNADVYGPPESMIGVDDPDESETSVTETTAFSADDNENPTVYGPPEDVVDEDETEATEVEEFDPAFNENPDVYGPPEDLVILDEEDVQEYETSEVSES